LDFPARRKDDQDRKQANMSTLWSKLTSRPSWQWWYKL